MNQIYDPPLGYGFGLDFDYDRWSPGSVVKLSTVSWDSQYRDVVLFDGHEQLNTYLNNKTITRTIDRVFHIKPDAPFIKLDVPYNAALKFNYLHVYNPAQPIDGDTPANFYYFITHVEYSAPNTSRVYLQLDVWQTYIYNVKLLSGYLERGHAGQVGEVVLKTPEPFDTGNSYINGNDFYSQNIINAVPGQSPSWHIAITSTIELAAAPGTAANPQMVAAQGTLIQGIVSPVSVYTLTLSDYFNFMTFLSAFPWVAQGIIDITLYPSSLGLGDRIPRSPWPEGDMGNWPPGASSGGVNDGYLRHAPDEYGKVLNYPALGNVRTIVKNAMKSVTPNSLHWAIDRYDKFCTAPYSYIEFHSNQGESSVLYPDGWSGSATINARASIAPGDASITFHSPNYSYDKSAGNVFTVRDFVKLPTLNNNAGIIMASQQRSIQAARDGARWTQDKALSSATAARGASLASNSLAGELSNIGTALDAENVGLSNSHAQNSSVLRAITGIAGGVVSGAPGGIAGIGVGTALTGGSAIADAVGTGMSIDLANQQLAARTNAANASRDAQSDTSIRMADANYRLASNAAIGDYSNTIAAIDAKVQDTMMTAPSMSGAFGGAMGVIAKYGSLALKARVKHLQPDAIIRHVQQWSRYGYYVNRFMQIDKLNIMRHFTYWKLHETYVDSSGLSLNNTLLLAIRGIFEKGVTVWNDPAKIGEYDFEGNVSL